MRATSSKVLFFVLFCFSFAQTTDIWFRSTHKWNFEPLNGSTVMRLLIVFLASHYPGNSRDLVRTYLGISTILCPCRTGTYPGLMRGDISVKRDGNLLPPNVHICQNSVQRRSGLWGRDLPGDLQEKFPPKSWAVPGAVPWTSQSTKLNPLASPRYFLAVGGWGYNW